MSPLASLAVIILLGLAATGAVVFIMRRALAKINSASGTEKEELIKQSAGLEESIQSSLGALLSHQPTSEKERLEQQEADLKARISEAESKKKSGAETQETLRKELTLKEEQLALLRKSKAEFDDLAQSLSANTDSLNSETLRLRSELDQSSAQIDSMISELALTELQKQSVQNLQATLASTKEKFQSASDGNAEARKRFIELQGQYSSLEKELERLLKKQEEDAAASDGKES